MAQAVALHKAGKLEEATAVYQKALRADSAQPDVHYLLGQIHSVRGDLDAALREVQRALELRPGSYIYLNLLGNIFRFRGSSGDAIMAYKQALEVEPSCIEVLNNLGLALQTIGKSDEAWTYFAKAEKLQPEHAETNLYIADLLRDTGKMAAALPYYERSERFGPENSLHYNEMGIYWGLQGEIAKGAVCFEKAIALEPTWADPINNLGMLRKDQCRLDEAVVLFKRAVELGSKRVIYHSNCLFCLNYHPELSAQNIYCEYEQWNARYALPVQQTRRFANTRDPKRRLRVGYVSPDFRYHPVTYFIEPLLARHDRNDVEVFAYANVQWNDAVTQRLRGLVDGWRDVQGLSDDELVARIVEDGIDILVDLAGHTQNNRLLTFARKPAPIQVSWLGYAYTTGLTAIDYFLSDPVLTPAGSEAVFAEKLVRLPTSLTYRPAADIGEPGTSPARRNGYVTFGSLSRSERLNHKVIAAWARILVQVPGSRLRLNSKSFTCADIRTMFIEQFAALGVGADRLELGYDSPVWDILRGIDITLDCFPHNSGTTLFESLYLGIPYVTLADRPSVGRLGAAILTGLGRTEWIATDVDEYVETVVRLAGDVETLAALRTGLRREMEASVLMDEARFARTVEAAYRTMWRRWCEGLAPESFDVSPEAADPVTERPAPSPGDLEKALALHQAGQLDQAEPLYRAVLAENPHHAGVLHLLGVIAHQRGHQEEACRLIAQAIALQPNVADFHSNLGNVFKALGRRPEAIASYIRAVEINPHSANALSNLGNCYREAGQPEQAVAWCSKAVACDPNLVAAHLNLGNALRDTGRIREALDAYEKGLQLQPASPGILNSKGITLADAGVLDEAKACLERAVAYAPDFVDAHNNLGVVLKEECRFDEALQAYGRARALDPTDADYGSNQLYCLNYHPEKRAEDVFEAYRQWDRQYAAALPRPTGYANDRDPERTLRVGYVSPDLRRHAVRYFIMPVLEGHDRSRVEVYAYAEVAQPDATTAAMRAVADHWRETVGLSDAALAERIQADGIDILVDLAGHTRGNRLLTFARKPAPIQVSWLGFACTTGLAAIDYFLGDAVFTPEGCDHLFAEKVVRLPGSLVYRPDEDPAPPGPLPARNKGYVTFGSLSRTVRLNDHVVRTWAEILRRVPHSHLMLNSRNFRCESVRRHYAQRFREYGIAPERLEMGYDTPVWASLQHIDIGLDCFPHNSGTTLFESLYMGVPIVTLADRPPVGRLGAAILAGLGCPEWIAATREEYIAKAVALATDLEGLAASRTSLRERMRRSRLMDEAGFVRNLEAAYRTMWRGWCEGREPAAFAVPGQTPATDQTLTAELAGIFAAAVAHHQAGRLPEAEQGYRHILAQMPHHADSLHLLGVLACQVGRNDLALEWIGRALTLREDCADYRSNYGEALRRLGRFPEAQAHLEKALALDPGHVNAALNLGAVLLDQGRFAEAEPWMRQCVEKAPTHVGAWYNMGTILKRLGRFAEAKACFETVLRLAPEHFEAMFQMGSVCEALLEPQTAIVWYGKALERNPDHPEALNNLGVLYNAQGRFTEAVAMLRRAATLKPDAAEIQCNLGIAFQHAGFLEEAGTAIRRAILLHPELAGCHSNLAAVLAGQGKTAEAEAQHRKALELEPDGAAWNRNYSVFLWKQMRFAQAMEYAGRATRTDRLFDRALGLAHQGLMGAYLSDFTQVKALSDAAVAVSPQDPIVWSQRLYSLSYHPDLDAETIYREFVRWGDGQACVTPPAYRNDRNPDRRLRVGFVSPDFRRHTSRFYFAPLLEHYSREEIAFYAYSNVLGGDDWTRRFQGWADEWRDIRGLSDEEAARQVEADGIDILIDGCNHMQHHRLGVFARKPAPIQVTWLGAAWTTGLPTVDYVLFDRYMAPEGTLTREKIVHLPGCFIAYRPPEDVAAVVPLPALRNGHVTFCYSGRTERLNHRTFRVWGEILRRLPGARLILDYGPFSDPPTQAYYRECMARHGLDPQRVTMRRSADIFSGLNDADIMLDCFPHSGGTMLFDALWMGLPALTLSGRPPVGRIGTSLMQNLGLSDWVTRSEEEYIERAVAQARDLDGLAAIRAGMRERMRHSPLMDERGFAGGYVAALRRMWRQWCA